MKKLILVFMVLTASRLAGQIPVYSFVHIGREEGLASNDVYDICQDETGFYWICTDNGLQRYDGKRWVSAGSGQQPALPDETVRQAVIAGRNEILLRFTYRYALFNSGNSSIQTVHAECSHFNESFFWKSRKHQLYLVCPHHGLFSYNRSTIRFERDRDFKIPDGFGLSCIYEDTIAHQLWLGGKKGLLAFDSTRQQIPHHLPQTHLSAFFIDGARRRWIVSGTSRQEFACYDQEGKPVPVEEELNASYKGHFRIDNFFYTRQAGLWLYGKNALFSYMPERGLFMNSKSDVTNPVGARFNTIRTMFQDREQGVWIATDQGIYEFYTSAPPVMNIILRVDNDDNSITDVEETGKGTLWVARRNKGIRALDTIGKKIQFPGLSAEQSAKKLAAFENVVDILYAKASGKVWLLGNDGSLCVTDATLSKKEFVRPSINPVAIAEDSRGDIWMASGRGQIARYQDSSIVVANIGAEVIKLQADQSGDVWVCTADKGLFRVNRQGKTNNYLAGNAVRTMVRLNDSICFAASDVLKIINIRTNTVRSVSFRHGLAGNFITGMEADKMGNIWIATSNGVCRYNYARNKFTVYGQKDGFTEYETIGTSTTKLQNGNILFAGSNLLSIFSPKDFNQPVAPPRVLITDILKQDKNAVTFYFSAMSYLQKDKLTYFYRLKQGGGEWINAGGQMAAVYSQLASGHYLFQVRCENEEGLSSVVTEYPFFIAPPFWKTWWFITLLIVVVSGVLYLFYRSKVKRILAVAELREKVARDLHDDVGSTLSTISILGEIAKGKLNSDPQQAEQYIGRISENSQQMMEAMDDIVWSIKPANDSMLRIIARMREVASATLEPKNIDIDFIVDEHVPDMKLNMESRRDLFLIFKEAINNIAKYSGCTRVGIYLHSSNRQLEMKIKDNGSGFTLQSAYNGNGISNMKKRAAMLNGSIRWQSEKGQGTQVQLVVPI